jgi:hypothetical protein
MTLGRRVDPGVTRGAPFRLTVDGESVDMG